MLLRPRHSGRGERDKARESGRTTSAAGTPEASLTLTLEVARHVGVARPRLCVISRHSTGGPVARVIVDVVLKPEILDPQGQAIVGALARLGVNGISDVRQGKHFELEVDEGIDDEAIAQLADTLLANPVIENFTIHR
jgi:phosphoribosylformylglycinamidine synthase subunit PurS